MATALPNGPIGIVGAGTMGAGIAQVAATGGLDVKLFDVAEGAADAARGRIAGFLERAAARGKISQSDAQAAVLRIEPVFSLEELGARAGWGHPLSPEDLAWRVQQRSLLEQALSTLPADEREVLVLRDVEGLSGEETAAAAGISLAAMKSRLHRGRLQLLAQVKAVVRP